MEKLICLVPFLFAGDVVAELNEPLWDKYGRCYGAYGVSGGVAGTHAFESSDNTNRILDAVLADIANLGSALEGFAAGERFGMGKESVGEDYRAVFNNAGQSAAENFRMREILDWGCERI